MGDGFETKYKLTVNMTDIKFLEISRRVITVF